MKKQKSVVVFGLILCLIFSACSIQNSSGSSVNAAVPQTVSDKGGRLLYYHELSEADQAIYNGLYHSVMQLQDYEYVYDDDGDDAETAERVFNILQFSLLPDHPEIFWTLGNGEYVSHHYLFKTKISIRIQYLFTPSEVQQYAAQLEDGLDKLVKEAPAEASDYEKSLWGYEWLIQHTTYVDKTAGEFPLEASAYGVLLQQKSNCNGYAKAYQLLMQRLDIPCSFVWGTDKEDNVQHAWNVIELDGDCYHVDATWGDPVYQENKAVLSHDYFCVNDAMLLKNRSVDAACKIRQCSATKYNYYVYNHIYIDALSDASVKKALCFALDHGYSQGELVFADKKLYQKARKQYFVSGRIYLILQEMQAQGYDVDFEEAYFYSTNASMNSIALDLAV